MNLVLAVSVLVALGCSAVVRINCLLALYNRKHLSDRTSDVLLWLGFAGLTVFILEFVTGIFNVII